MAGGNAGRSSPTPARDQLFTDLILDTTEILRTINGNWTMVASLPNSMQKLSGATLGNEVFMTGEYKSLSLYSE